MPQLPYLETISKPAEAEGKYIRQTGGHGNYAHVKLRLEPNERGKGIEFLNQIKGGVIPQQFIPPIEAGIREAAQGGILAGHAVVDFKATLYDGSFHEVDSNPVAFQIAASLAFKEAARKANPVLLEPVMAVEVTVPEEHRGTIIGGINARRGRIEGMEHVGGSQVIKAMVPLKEMIGYEDDIRSSTQGRASCTIQFSGYEPVPRPPDPADEAGVAARRPRGSGPGSDSAAVKPDWDWT